MYKVKLSVRLTDKEHAHLKDKLITGRTANKKYINENVSILNKFTDLKNNAHWAYCGIVKETNIHKAITFEKAETWIK